MSEQHANPIMPSIIPLLEAFLAEERFQEIFEDMAKAAKIEYKDKDEMKTKLFTVSKDGNIGFIIGELNTMFNDFSIEFHLRKDPIYKYHMDDPAKRDKIIQISKKILNKQTISEDETAYLDSIIHWKNGKRAN